MNDIADDLYNKNTISRNDIIDKTIYKHNKNISLYNLSIATELINCYNESHIINYYKCLYKNKGITLRTNRKCPITILTINGPITIVRYVLRPKNKEDYDKLYELDGVSVIIPKDEYLGLSVLPTKMTVEAMLMTARKAQELSSYKLAEEILRNDLGIDICAATIMNVTNIIGSIAFKTEREKAEEAYDLFLRSKLDFNNKREGTIYIETDGAMFNTRNTSTNGTTWCENKLGLVFSSDNISIYTNRKTNEKYHKINKKEYTSYIGESSEFKKFLFACALRNGYGLFAETVLISDGSKWIKSVKDELFYDAILILDFFHLKEKVYDFGKLYFNHVENKYKPWAEQICGLLRESKFNQVLQNIGTMQQKMSKKENSINLASYLENNIDNIDYKNYRNKGYFIGSGAIEGANKNVLQKRLNQAGMRWNKESAQYVVTLKAKKESQLWYKDVVLPVKQYYGM
jgi:hypothetical protein